jgi:predicted membrane channel-forming protein YqfA (hemolysin III family)
LVAGIKLPRLSAILGAFYFIGRYLYNTGYKKSPKQRELGSLFSHGSTILLIVSSLISAVKLCLKK